MIGEPYAFFPAQNATLNGTSSRGAARRSISDGARRITAHGASMVAAVIAWALFPGCHQFLPRKLGNIRFLGEGWLRPVYCAILVAQVTLDIVIVPFPSSP